MEPILLNEGTQNEEVLTLCKLETHHIASIMALQDKIVEALTNKELFVASSSEEYKNIIESIGCMMAYQTQSGKLVALAAYSDYGYDVHNYGYDLGLEGEDLLLAGQIESVMVDSDYRGLGLQRKLCQQLEEVAKAEGKTYLTATVSPINPFSLNNFIKLGFENKLEKLKYGGLKRCILCKTLK